MSEKFIRVQLEMSPESLKRIDQLRGDTGIRTRKELFENALSLFAKAVEQSRSGRRVAFIDPEHDRYREFSMPALETAFKKKH